MTDQKPPYITLSRGGAPSGGYEICEFPGIRSAGRLLFTSAYDGVGDFAGRAIDPALAGDARAQCENAYGKLCTGLAEAGLPPGAVARLEHYTSSQDWLTERSAIRARVFGHPAPLASTGVSARMRGINMLSVAAVAVTDLSDKEVMVEGNAYGIPHLSSLVRAGPLWFLSGLRGHHDPLTGRALAEETPSAFEMQTRAIYRTVLALLAQAGATVHDIVRVEIYLRDPSQAAAECAIRIEMLGEIRAVATAMALPLGGRGEMEITVTLAAPGTAKSSSGAIAGRQHSSAGGVHFLAAVEGNTACQAHAGDFRAQTVRALVDLDEQLLSLGLTAADIVRIELVLRSIYVANASQQILAEYFGRTRPTLVTIGADLPGGVEIRINAIAYCSPH